jgi:hypothetical protein
MKNVVLSIEERKYKFFMELLKNFDFVSIQKEDFAKKQSLRLITQGMQSAILASEGKIKSRNAKSFLNEL